MVIWWFYVWNYNVPVEKIAYHFDKVVLEGQYWRVITAGLSHLNLLHVGFNMVSMYSMAWIEQYLGSIEYLRISFILLIGSFCAMTLIVYILDRFAHRPQHRNHYVLGYSGVVFGWLSIGAMLNGGAMSFFGLQVPYFTYPFVALIVTSLIIPNASFIGHLAGLIIGFLVYFEVFFWFTDYLYLTAAIWTAIVFVATLKTTTEFSWLSCIEITSAEQPGQDFEQGRRTLVNGEIVYVDRSGDFEIADGTV